MLTPRGPLQEARKEPIDTFRIQLKQPSELFDFAGKDFGIRSFPVFPEREIPRDVSLVGDPLPMLLGLDAKPRGARFKHLEDILQTKNMK